MVEINANSAMIDSMLERISDQRRRDEGCSEAAQYAIQAGDVELIASIAAKISDPIMRDKCLRNILFNSIAKSPEQQLLHFWQDLQAPLRRRGLRKNEGPLLDPRWLLMEERLMNFLASCAVARKLDTLETVLAPLDSGTLCQLLRASISAGHVALAFHLLPRLKGRDINRKDESGSTALMLAAERGHDLLIGPLLDQGAGIEMQDKNGQTALTRAYKEGQFKLAKSLIDRGAQPNPALEQLSSKRGVQSDSARFTLPDDEFLSSELHQLLNEAGFTAERVRCLQEMADMLELSACSVTSEDRKLTGSYAEGWANSLAQLNGRTDKDSDIDWTVLIDLEPFHLEGACQCRKIPAERKLKVKEGHALLQGDAGSQPAVWMKACGVRPAQDTCHAFPCCSSFFQQRVDLLLPASGRAPSVHLVRAARPERSSELWVSFSFQEKAIMRQLCTVQGQLFVLLKLIFKRLLPSTSGLKTYHAKSLLFYMLERHGTESGDWKASNLVRVLKEALDLMLNFLDKNAVPEICMPHFFMPDAPLYFKNSVVSNSSERKLQVRGLLDGLRKDLSPLVHYIRESGLKRLESEQFFFHPFTLIPMTSVFTEQQVRRLLLVHSDLLHLMQSLYCLAHQILVELNSAHANMQAVGDKLFILDCMPDFCRCAAVCLKVMAHLKGKKTEKAKEMLQDNSELSVPSGLSPASIGRSRGWFADSPSAAFRFCFPCLGELRLGFLPEFSRSLVAVKLSDGRSHHLYANFRCLLWSLLAELLPGGQPKTDGWVGLARQNPDWSELVTMAHYSSDAALLSFCLERMEAMAQDVELSSDEAQMLNDVRNKLQRLA